MRTNQQGDFVRGGCPSHSKLNTVVTAAVFIIVGLLFLGRNFGVIDSDLFDILVSWQMLLIVVGVVNLIKRHFFGGMIMIAIGTYFLLPEISGVENEWIGMFWPVLLILVGIMILFKPKRHRFNGHWDGRRPEYVKDIALKTVLSYRTTLSDRFSRLSWTRCSEGHGLEMCLAELSWIYGGANWPLPGHL